ncbi:MAG: TetR/AcrR family transcriptional regulator, partial [Chloroflexi bacterium]|nr:TetR/AcrR family transcriptional regulator [Chloroflexota bacterium]
MTRTERKKEETRQKIMATAVHLFQQYGFDETTMEQIAAQADIAKGTLYNYFPVKEAVLSVYIEQSFEDQRAERLLKLRQMPDTRARLTLILSALMERVQVQKDIFEKYLAYRIQLVVSLRPDPDQAVKNDFDLLAAEIIQL